MASETNQRIVANVLGMLERGGTPPHVLARCEALLTAAADGIGQADVTVPLPEINASVTLVGHPPPLRRRVVALLRNVCAASPFR